MSVWSFVLTFPSPLVAPVPPVPRPPATLGALLDRGLFLPDGTLDEARVQQALERFCASGDPVACLVLAAGGRPAEGAPPAGADVASMDRWCREGDPDACAVSAWWAAADAADRRTAACALGGEAACVLAARARVRAGGDVASARRVAERACRSGVPAGCLLRAELEPDARIRRAQLGALCSDGDARGCARLWALTTRGAVKDSALAAHAAQRGCSLGVAHLCAAVAGADPQVARRLAVGCLESGVESCRYGATSSTSASKTPIRE